MANEKMKINTAVASEQHKEKATPAFLRDDYSYKAVGDAVTDMSQVIDGEIYEIKCPLCEMSIRSQGQNIRDTSKRMQNSGCIGCGNKAIVVKRVDMFAEHKGK